MQSETRNAFAPGPTLNSRLITLNFHSNLYYAKEKGKNASKKAAVAPSQIGIAAIEPFTSSQETIGDSFAEKSRDNPYVFALRFRFGT